MKVDLTMELASTMSTFSSKRLHYVISTPLGRNASLESIQGVPEKMRSQRCTSKTKATANGVFRETFEMKNNLCFIKIR